MHERSHHGTDEHAFVVVHCVMPAHGRLCTPRVHHPIRHKVAHRAQSYTSIIRAVEVQKSNGYDLLQIYINNCTHPFVP
jgi:hypothetical protein